MTTLDNGIVVEESIDAAHFTLNADCPAVFGLSREWLGATVHHWGADGQDFDDVVAYLASDNDRESSAEFVVQEDRVACIVSPAAAASWHAGNAYGTVKTIGIECRPEMTPGDLLTLESLIRFLESTYGELLIFKHNDWTNTACPGRYAGQIENIVAGINNVTVAIPGPVVMNPNQPEHKCCCHD